MARKGQQQGAMEKIMKVAVQHHKCRTETPFVVWPCNEKRRHGCCNCKASNNDEGGREETSRKAHTEVDGQSAERFETTPVRSKARREPRSMEESSDGDRPRTGILDWNWNFFFLTDSYIILAK